MALNQVGLERLNTATTKKIGMSKNIIINGAMQHNQRVQTGTLGYYNPVTSSIYTLDRWRWSVGNSFDTNSARITQDSSGPDGFSNSWKIEIFNTQTPSGQQNGGVEQKIEAQNLQGLGYGTSAAKTMTLSFYVKSFKTGTYCVQIMQEDGTKYQLHEYTINQSNTWERKTITITGNTSDAINNDNGVGLRIIWALVVGSSDHASATSSWVSGGSFVATSNQVNLWDNTNNDFFLTGCQLEIGTVATDFEHRSFAEELTLCQRYFFRISGDNGQRPGIPGFANSSSNCRFQVTFPTNMRALPSITGTATNCVFDSSDDSDIFQCNGLSSGGGGTQSNPHIMVIEANPGGMTAGQGGHFEFRATGSISFSSEL